MLSMLKGGRSKDLENVVAHSQPSYGGGARPTLPPGVSFASNTSSGPSFFERLFGGGSPNTPPAPVGRRVQQQQRR